MSKRQVFIVILPNGRRHELSEFFFSYYKEIGLIRIQRSKSTMAVGRLTKWVRAWPLPSGALRFELIEPPAYDPYYDLDAVTKLWKRILALAAYQDESMNERTYGRLTAAEVV